MTISYDPIPVFEAAGYTEREAAFLYLTAVHSGYFLRRQYVRFIQRGRGALAEQFLRRASALGHIQSIACGQARFVYHVHASAIYEAAGLAALRHRRLKGDASIKARLMVLDFVLDHLDDSMLDTREAKIAHFTGIGIAEDRLPHLYGAPFADDYPIFAKETLCFTFFDEGALSTSAFENFLRRHHALFIALQGFELTYVADSAQSAERGRSVFAAKLSLNRAPGVSPLAPRGAAHLLDYLAARVRVESPSEPPTLRDLAVLREGEAIYALPEHDALLSEWQSGSVGKERVGQRLRQQMGHLQFSSVVLPYRYPLHHFRRERQEVSDLRSSDGSSAAHLFEP